MAERIRAKAILFDLDGTLFDSVGLWHEIDDIFLSRRGKTPTAEYKKKIAALGSNRVADFTIEYYGLTDTPEQLLCEWSDLAHDAYAHTVRIFDGVREYLDDCRAAGVKIAAVTSLRRDLAEPGLINNGIEKYFLHIFTADETGLSKTGGEIYAHAARELGVLPEQCVAVDDVAEAIISAKSVGMTTIAIAGKMLDADECAASADFLVGSLFEAPGLELMD